MSDSIKHAPGPWVVQGRWVNRHVNAAAVAQVYCGGGVEEPRRAANARLIAAAPDMLEALEHMTAVCEVQVKPWSLTTGMRREAYERAAAAIAKAKG